MHIVILAHKRVCIPSLLPLGSQVIHNTSFFSFNKSNSCKALEFNKSNLHSLRSVSPTLRPILRDLEFGTSLE